MTKPAGAPPDPWPPTAACAALSAAWGGWMEAICAQIAARRCHPSRVVVLVPYAQMMSAGRQAWVQQQGSGFGPRFESTRNWAASLQPFWPGATDVSGDTARDSLVAAGLLDRVAGRGLPATLRASLVSRLVDAARQLAPVAAAQHPAQRAAWADALRPTLTANRPLLQWEGLVASLGLTWAGLSAYATDVLWSELAAPGAAADALLLLPGFQTDPLAAALLARWGEQAALLPPAVGGDGGSCPSGVVGHPCSDAEDEAQRTAACVIERVNAGQVPVALVAQDRLLTRRIGALLHGAGVGVRDETGWKLSTTHAAARLMSLLRAADRRARTDEVLDWLKQGTPFPTLDALERLARRQGLAQWSRVLAHAPARALVPTSAAELLAGLQAPRPLLAWLLDLTQALQQDGWWEACSQDAAGARVIEVLHLQAAAAHELDALSADVDEAGAAPRHRWPLSAFVAWVREALEAASFQPGSEEAAAVVVLPMAQLLGRGWGAVVAPGCDEIHLPTSPEPPGQWSAEQRTLLGLPARDALAQAAHAAWRHLLSQAPVHLLWRTQHQGEALGAAPWVQALLDAQAVVPGADPRVLRGLAPALSGPARPVVPDLLPQALSATAYQDLRDCPYRFFALRLLQLQAVDEIEDEPDKRDLGNWLHAVLKAFHEARASAPDDGMGDRERIEALALAEARQRGLAGDGATGMAGGASAEASAAFLPFMAAWPALRDGYLAWLAAFEPQGPRFVRAEVSLQRKLGPWRLVGQIDREDRQASPEGPIPFVIDYKTESRQTTLNRVKDPLEDTQIAFYAALLGDDTVRGAYLSITDSRETEGANTATRLVEQPHIELARDHLLAGIASDLTRVAGGHPLAALGEGRVCDFCDARGLCRKDFRE